MLMIKACEQAASPRRSRRTRNPLSLAKSKPEISMKLPCHAAIFALSILVAPVYALKQLPALPRLKTTRPQPLRAGEASRAQFLLSMASFLGLPSQAAVAAGSSSGGPPPLLRLSRAELTKKLARVPVFYVQRGGGGGGVELNSQGVGEFFLEQSDADAAASKLGDLSAFVGVSFLGDVYLSLLRKSAKLELFPPATLVGRTVSAGHGEATFVLVPSSKEVNAAQKWGYSPITSSDSSSTATSGASNEGGGGRSAGAGVPLFFAPRLAYQGTGMDVGAVQKPLFFSENAALDALVDRKRREAKRDGKAYDPTTAASPAQGEIVVIDLALLLNAMLSGLPPKPLSPTEDMRSLEFFASRSAVEATQSTYAAQLARGG